MPADAHWPRRATESTIVRLFSGVGYRLDNKRLLLIKPSALGDVVQAAATAKR